MRKKIIFLVSGMNTWENTMPLIYKLDKKKFSVTLGIETYNFYIKFRNDNFRENFLLENNINCIHLSKPRNIKEVFYLFNFYLSLIFCKFDYIIETTDFDIDLKITKFFLCFQIFKGCKRIKNFCDNMSFNEKKNTQLFYDKLSMANKKLNFKKYNHVLLSSDKKDYIMIYKKLIIFSENKNQTINIGKPKFEKKWINYILNYYKNNVCRYDILIPLSATKGNFIKGNQALDQENKLYIIFKVLNEIGNIKIVLKPHSKTDLSVIYELQKKYESLDIVIKTDHLYSLISTSKFMLTYHPTSAQIYTKIFNKKCVEFGNYDPRVEKAFEYKPRYHESVDEWVRDSRNTLKNVLIKYLKNSREDKKNFKEIKNNRFEKLVN